VRHPPLTESHAPLFHISVPADNGSAHPFDHPFRARSWRKRGPLSFLPTRLSRKEASRICLTAHCPHQLLVQLFVSHLRGGGFLAVVVRAGVRAGVRIRVRALPLLLFVLRPALRGAAPECATSVYCKRRAVPRASL